MILSTLLSLAPSLVPQDAGQDADAAPPAATDVQGLRPTLPRPELVARARAARERGLAHLLRTQNADGSWGSHDPKAASLLNFGFGTANAGSQDAVRLACTAICAQALLETDGRGPELARALDRALDVLLVPQTFAYHPGEAFNTWGYGVKLDFLGRLWSTPEGEPLRERILPAAERCIAGLKRFQQHEGGWGYYAGPLQDFESMSFNTGNFLGALARARSLGWEVPEGMVEDAAHVLLKMRVPDGSFVYSTSHLLNPQIVLANLGAGSRTVAAAMGLLQAGLYDEEDLARSLAVFDVGENYLEDGRKLIVPHSAVQMISGYFFFYGYNYASELAVVLGDRVPLERWDRFAWTMLRTQDSDGSWWDTAAADYGDKWGTGFALLTLGRYLAEVERRPEVDEGEGR